MRVSVLCKAIASIFLEVGRAAIDVSQVRLEGQLRCSCVLPIACPNTHDYLNFSEPRLSNRLACDLAVIARAGWCATLRP